MKKFSEIMDLMDSAKFVCINNLVDVGGVIDEVKDINWDNVDYDIDCTDDDIDYISGVYDDIDHYEARGQHYRFD